MTKTTTALAETAPEVLPAQTDQEALPPVPANEGAAASLMRMIERVTLDPNFDVAKLNQLLDVKERWDREEARKAYHAAMARFQSDLPKIGKNQHVHYPSRDQNQPATDYWHADLAEYVYKVAPALGVQGLSYDHDIEQTDDGLIIITCILTHESGHSRSVTMKAPPDQSGGKNAIQQIKSTKTYLRRGTLEAVTGLAAEGDDDDGRGAGPAIELITTMQLAELNAAIDEVGADRDAFLKFLGVERLEDLPLEHHGKAISALETKRNRASAQAPAKEAQAAPTSQDPDPVTQSEHQ